MKERWRLVKVDDNAEEVLSSVELKYMEFVGFAGGQSPRSHPESPHEGWWELLVQGRG